jgi:hypothetical protein
MPVPCKHGSFHFAAEFRRLVHLWTGLGEGFNCAMESLTITTVDTSLNDIEMRGLLSQERDISSDPFHPSSACSYRWPRQHSADSNMPTR